MIRIEPFELEDFDRLDLLESDREFVLGQEPKKVLEELGTMGAIFTVFYGTTILGIYGFSRLKANPGVAEVWSFPTVHIKKKPIAFFKAVQELVRIAFEVYGLYRVQCYVLDASDSCRWLQRLGFKKEGVLTGFSFDRRDCALWARVEMGVL